MAACWQFRLTHSPAACLQRKKTLLVEYRQLRKANAFVDRRFGEDNEGLTPEEKAIVRFQKQRMSQAGGRQLQCRCAACISASCFCHPASSGSDSSS